MSLDRRIYRMNHAIRACLKGCYASSDPLHELAKFLQELRCNPEWHPDDIFQIEQTARRILKGVIVRRRDDRLSPSRRSSTHA